MGSQRISNSNKKMHHKVGKKSKFYFPGIMHQRLIKQKFEKISELFLLK